MLEKIAKWVGKYPIIVISAIILLTVLFYFGLGRISIITDMKEMLPEDDPAVKAFDGVADTFGGSEYVMILLDMGDVFNTDVLHKIDRLTQHLEELNGVNSVSSITNIEEIRGVEDGIEVVKVIEGIPTGKADLKNLRNRVLSDDNYAGQIVSKNGKIALLVVQLLPTDDTESVISGIKKVVKKLELDEFASLTGKQAAAQEASETSAEDMGKLILLAILVMIAILFFSFRNIRGVVLPLLIVIVTVIWTVGLMGFIGTPLSSISIIMPIILISMGIADGVHILARYREELLLGSDKRKSFSRTVINVGLACFLTSITTMIGFGSLYISSLRAIKEFGLFTAIGVGIAFIITVTLFLAILYLLPVNRKKANKKPKFLMKGILETWANFIVAKAKIILLAAGFLAFISGVGILFIRIETDPITFFAPDSNVRKAFNTIKENFGGSEIMQIVVKGNIQDPKVLKSMDNFQNEIEKIEIVSKPSSIVNFLKNTNKALHEGSHEYEILPETEEEVAQYLLLLSMGSEGGSDTLDNFITFEYDQALIQARVSSFRISELIKMIDEVENAIVKHFSSDVDVLLTGYPVLTPTMVDLLVKGQLESLALAILFVFVLMILLSRSLAYGIFCTIPVSLTVILNFGIMGWFKIPLDIASAIIASVAIGIGIDYAIHFFNRYKEELNMGKSVSEAVKITISNTGRAIFYNAAAVGLGFFVLIFSSMPPLARFGLLIALTMFFSGTASITILPALLFLRDRNRISTEKLNKERGK